MIRCTHIVVSSMILLTFLLSACSSNVPAVDSVTAVATSSPASGQFSHVGQPDEDVQNLTEMQLVMLFQTLLRMDRNASLVITTKQAAAMLPSIRQSMEEGSMSDAERKQVLRSLTAEQKAFLDEQIKQLTQRIAKRVDNPGLALSDEEREKRIDAFIARRKAGREAEAGEMDRTDGEKPQMDPKTMGMSIEQQLVDLLVSKQN
ncbi:hypothetical protein HQN90_01230 [Paenibacillus alba]|uniref:hypothetical protein n=1 Tax=Paenibacillus alba TaxID=1197127 RepID=UPI0015643A9F|nr:hypothetical protein [Paenibacillus alba]NQX64739.1 hypothetical protein [Paenibacillus alba]